jgi:NTP pyrophosphatase (non-canonical NTP hydrolase)
MKDSPINEYQQLMAITAEECGELVQVCMKIIRMFDDHEQIDDKRMSHLIEEAGDVYAMIDLLCEHNVLQWKDIHDRALVKRNKLKTWSNLVK